MTPNPTVKQSLTVPLEPTKEMIDVAVSFALNVSLSGEYNWSAYMRDVWQRMVKAAPAEVAQGEAVSLIVERDVFGTMHIKMPAHDDGEPFDFVQVQYRYPYTDNQGTQKLAEKIAELISGQPLTAPPSPNAELVKVLRELRSGVSCESLHHKFSELHRHNEPCKVLERIDAKLASLKGERT